MLIPTWLLLVVWVAAAGFTVLGQLQSDLVAPALIGGLVLIVMLIGFTVMQHAFAGGALSHGSVTDSERRALALSGSGDVVFDWDVVSDRVFVSPEVETLLGLKRGALVGPAAGFLDLVHPFDRDRAGAAFDSVIEQRRGRITPGLPPARDAGDLSLVQAEGATGGGLRRRGHPDRRHPGRRHREQDLGRAAPVRRRARQPHRPSQPPAFRRPSRLGPRLRRAGPGAAPGRGDGRHRPVQADQREPSVSPEAMRSCSPCRAASAGCCARRTRWRASPATASASSSSPSATRTG